MPIDQDHIWEHLFRSFIMYSVLDHFLPFFYRHKPFKMRLLYLQSFALLSEFMLCQAKREQFQEFLYQPDPFQIVSSSISHLVVHAGS